MANDRLYFRCNECKETVLIAKYWVSHLAPWNDLQPLAEFLRAHSSCAIGDEICISDVFSLERESDRDG